MPAAPAVNVPSGRTLLGIVALVLLLLFPTFFSPLGRDQAVAAYIGQEITRGRLPYRDAWEVRPPGIYLAYSVPARLASGDGLRMTRLVRAMDVVLTMLGCCLLALLAYKLGQGELALPAVIWFCALYCVPGHWCWAEPESWANPLLLGALLMFWTAVSAPARPLFWLSVGAGVLAGSALLLKPTSIGPLLALLALRPWKREAWGGLLAGVAGSLLLCLWWMSQSGILQDYLQIQQTFVARYYPWQKTLALRNLFNAGLCIVAWTLRYILPSTLVALGLAALWVRRPVRQLWLLPTMLLGALLTFWMQWTHIDYQLQPALPALALLAAGGSLFLLQCLRLPARAMLPLMVLLPCFWHVTRTWRDYTLSAAAAADIAGGAPVVLQEMRMAALAHDPSMQTIVRSAQLVRRSTGSNDTILVWGYEPLIYVLSKRRAAGRFLFIQPVVSRFGMRAWRQEFLQDLLRRAPALVVLERRDNLAWMGAANVSTEELLRNWRPLQRWLAADYTPATNIGTIAIYTRQRRSSRLPQPIRVAGFAVI